MSPPRSRTRDLLSSHGRPQHDEEGHRVPRLVPRSERRRAREAKIAVSPISRLDTEDRIRITVASRTAEVRAEELQGIFDPIQVVQGNLIDVGPCVSQRIIEAQGGRLDAKQGRGDVSFTASLAAARA